VQVAAQQQQAGIQAPTAHMLTSSNCLDVPAGASACAYCLAGTYAAGGACQPCPSGTVSTSAGATKCTQVRQGAARVSPPTKGEARRRGGGGIHHQMRAAEPTAHARAGWGLQPYPYCKLSLTHPTAAAFCCVQCGPNLVPGIGATACVPCALPGSYQYSMGIMNPVQ
jgi:hypothetical protein